jgi:hypothetical protein
LLIFCVWILGLVTQSLLNGCTLHFARLAVVTWALLRVVVGRKVWLICP